MTAENRNVILNAVKNLGLLKPVGPVDNLPGQAGMPAPPATDFFGGADILVRPKPLAPWCAANP
jgi:hypothetical protein